MKKLTLSALIGKETYNSDVVVVGEDGELTAIALGLLHKGYGETLRDATARFPGDPDKQLEAIVERNGKIADGSYTFGGGGGGARLDADEKADIQYWNGRREKKTPLITGKTLQDTWVFQTARVMVANKVADNLEAAVELMEQEHLDKYMEYVRGTSAWKKIRAALDAQKPAKEELPQLF